MDYTALIVEYRYLLLIPLLVFEGPVATFLAAFLASQGDFNPISIFVVAVLANLAGDMLYYCGGRYGGGFITGKWGAILHFDGRRILKLSHHFDRHGGKSLILGKLSVVFGGPVLVSAGIAKYSPFKFLWYSLLGEIPKTAALFCLGYFFGATIHDFGHYVTEYALVAALVGASCYLVYRRMNQDAELNT